MSTRDLEFFRVVAASESLTAASRELGSSLPAVSRRLAALEARLGVRLVTRGARRLRLTSEGELYAERGADIVDRVRALEEQLAERTGRLRGAVVVEATPGFGRAHVAPVLGEFAADHPDVVVRLQLSSLPPRPQRTGADLTVHVGAAPDSTLRLRRLARNRRVPCAAPSYLERHGAPTTVADLAEHRCIVLRENESDFATWRFGTAGRPQTFRAHGHLASNDGDVVTGWALAGLGVVMRSQWQVQAHLDSGALVRLLPHVPTPPADVVALLDTEAHVPRRVTALLDLLASRLPQRLGR